MSMQPFDQGQGSGARVSLQTLSYGILAVAILIVLGVAFSVGHLGWGIAFLIWPVLGIWMGGVLPEYDDEDTNINPMIRFSMLIGLMVMVFLFALFGKTIPAEQVPGSMYYLGLLGMLAMMFLGEGYSSPSRPQRSKGTRARARKKQQAQLPDGGDATTQRLGEGDREGIPEERR